MMVLNAECERCCMWVWPFGFLPEAGCPVHDPASGGHAVDGRPWQEWTRTIALEWPVKGGRIWGPLCLN